MPDRRDAGVFLLLLAGLFLTYCTVLIWPYAYLDDYFWLDLSTRLPGDLYEALAVQGRPLNGLILRWVFSHAGGIGGLRWVRALTLAELSAMAWMFYMAVKWNGWSRTTAVLLALMASSLPAVQVYAAWATSVPIPWAGMLACVAAILTGWAVDDLQRRWTAALPAAVLLLASATIYQPAAMIFWPVAALDLFRRNRDERMVRRFAVYFVVAIVGLFLAYLVFKHGLATYTRRPSIQRDGVTHDPKEKVKWFLEHPLVDSLNLFNLRPAPWVAGIVGGIMFVGLSRYFMRRRLISIMIMLSLLPLSYLPNLVAKESWSSYRTQIGLSWLVLVFAWIACNGIFQLAQDGWWPTRRFLALIFPVILMLVVAIPLAAGQVGSLIVAPQYVELVALRGELSSMGSRAIKRIILLQPRGTSKFAPYSRYDEFGRYSMEGFWVPESAINLIRKETDPNPPPIQFDLVPDFQGKWTEVEPADTAVFDMRFLNPSP